MIETIKEHGVYLAIGLFFGYRIWRTRQVKRQLPQLLDKGGVVVDVRSPQEFSAGSNPGSLNIPLHELNSRLSQLSKDKPIILCCASGSRSGMASLILKKAGFKNVVNAGSWTNTVAER